jgi:Bacterial transglutaminase-like N-terminal region
VCDDLNIIRITIHHYDLPAEFGSNQLMLRPRDSCMLRVLACDLTITPEAKVVW